MKIIEEVTEPREQVTDVLCDICNKSTRDSCDMNYEFAELKVDWGYGSDKDTESHECHMCESCYDKVRTFIHSIGGKVRTSNYSPGCWGATSVPK